MGDHSPNENDELADYDRYGRTPPRTKISRKNRERKQRDRLASSPMASTKIIKANGPLNRRNTMESFFSDGLNEESDTMDSGEAPKRLSKRQMKLLRGSERDLKLDIERAQTIAAEHFRGEGDVFTPKTPSYQIETKKRFRSLICRTYPCNKVKEKDESQKPDESYSGDNEENTASDQCLQSRVVFYDTLKLLIRMGSGDKCLDRHPRRGISKEETPWQNELSDVIWLELQAYHAERSPTEEDAYLCAARDMVEPLLNDIKNYKFRRHLKDRKYSTSNSDSGVEDDCSGCVSMYCHPCLDAQNEALHDIDDLMKRLEEAVSLFPSSRAFAELYPLYSSPAIIGRVKAMCLWYNLTKHQRLKINILVRLLTTMDMKSSTSHTGDDSTSGSPSDSNNSSNSASYDILSCVNQDLYNFPPIDDAIGLFGKHSCYRKYIENILKTTALDKSLEFLKKLHKNVLIKAQMTLRKPDNDDIFSEVCVEDAEEELFRYGTWSPEAIEMALPSYRTIFIFLSMVPLQVVHAYLEMRLEQKPKKPSPLSVRQLLRESRDGLRIAVSERNRACSYIESAMDSTDMDFDNFKEQLKQFDESVEKLFIDYLDYLQQWALLSKDAVPKNLLQEEYNFCSSVIDDITSGETLMENTYCFIIASLLKRTIEKLSTRIGAVLKIVNESGESNIKQNIFTVCRELQTLINETRDNTLKILTLLRIFRKHNFTIENKNSLKNSLIAYRDVIADSIAKIQGMFDHTCINSLDEADKNAVNSRIREILMQAYRFGFDFYKDMSADIPPSARFRIVPSMVELATLWMKFVTKRCEKGRGKRPRWAYQGMEFLLTVCEPANTAYLSEDVFETLKKDMDLCISHVIGTVKPTTPDSGFHSVSPRPSLEHIRARSRGSSPSPRPAYKSQRSGNRKTSMEQQSPLVDSVDVSPQHSVVKPIDSPKCTPVIKVINASNSHSDSWREAVEALEQDIDKKLREQNLIGRVLHDRTLNKNFHRRNVTFSWQRGIKIGQGRFGKVYTAVNNNTGDMMAVKEIALQHNDAMTIKQVSEEMKILEGIMHPNILKYYGVEVHKDEMLIFMEYCSEGTLETLISATEHGLPESLVRRYTFQLVSGVKCLHEHGIVHRDIKTANTFLTNEGNCLKIGDFGCAAKIKSNTTMPGELKGFVGTQAYMAPEVFTKNMSEGHGRAADIWSVGCVVVEMASGERPWAQYDSNYQIMFKVGMGQSPDPPDNMIDEGLDFLEMCFKHDPKERASAKELLYHNFVKAGEDLN